MAEQAVMTAMRSAFDRRTAPGRALAGDADVLARACRAMAERFRAGGKLIVFGNGAACADADHVAVEFVHPVIVGKRALPAISLAGDAASLTAVAGAQGLTEVFAARIRLLAAPADIALGISPDGRCPNVLRGLRAAREAGLLTVALVGGGEAGAGEAGAVADHVLAARCDDPLLVREIHVTAYHMLWELVHVFLDRMPAPPVNAETASPSCAGDDTCLTCSDAAVPVRVRKLLGGGRALAETGTGTEEISVALVDAGPGDTVLVHAGEAIAVVGRSA
ncbi:SIS domain-containing protein [Thermostaphylospora chromogena]|uniref:D-sedoheptulose 7-phosphate isomerase n=1 Tax=Thermostaphylospora chromogena TaxID=35622 RepID=A0A1H1H5H2_9ACTN|nr:SIS domain-containing protein [Thermostaphylospora chromogena]SDR20621.1 D-sedoheptulose 7-phosphate isomerase [Thermostaphylospora chromogena]